MLSKVKNPHNMHCNLLKMCCFYLPDWIPLVSRICNSYTIDFVLIQYLHVDAL